MDGKVNEGEIDDPIADAQLNLVVATGRLLEASEELRKHYETLRELLLVWGEEQGLS